MSYILDALQHREAQENPQTAAAKVIKHHRDQRLRMVGVVVGVALIVNAGVLIWLLAPAPEPTSKPAAPVAGPALSSQPPSPPQAVTAEPVLVAPTPPAAAPPVRTSLQRLPASVRERFPGLVFSTHIYADDASLRAVVANGQRLTEGDGIGEATLEQITATGVVLGFENYLVEIPVIADWQ